METNRSAELAVFGHKPAYYRDFRQNYLSAECPRETRKDPVAGVATPTPAVASRRADLWHVRSDCDFSNATRSVRARHPNI
jgi:hypothetical protein